MASLIPGFNYDIFISYRQKDNKYDGWVTEFVDHLKSELEATFKEEITVYFDLNPHDGLLETHDVDASLKEKLRCLIFIPIISRTYCDPKSFAWEHEFKAFVEQASQDQFGLKVKLPNGNVASRVLPVCIYELDSEDQKECESVLGGMLRGIEFIYKEPGVNKPLTSDDDENKNLNSTKYRIQVNKVGNAIKELVEALEQHELGPHINSREILASTSGTRRKFKTPLIAGSIIGFVLILLGILIIPELLKREVQPDKSIAVLPFVNLSNDPEQEYFSDGMVDEILDRLFKIGDLKVISRTSSMRYKDSKLPLKEIARELGVNNLLEGSVRRINNNVRITVQLIDAKSDSHIWSQIYDKDLSDIFSVQSEIAKNIAGELRTVLSTDEINQIDRIPTENVEAYNLYLKGRFFWNKRTIDDLKKSINYFEDAIHLDTTFALAYTSLADSYIVLGEWNFLPPEEAFPQAKRAAMKAIELNYDLAEAHNALAAIKRDYEWDWDGAEHEYLKAIELNPKYPTVYQWYAEYLSIMGRNDEAIENITHAQELDPLSPAIYTVAGHIIYHNAKLYDNAILQCQKALEIDSNYVLAHYALAFNLLRLDKFEEAITEAKKAQFLSGEYDLEGQILPLVYAQSGRRGEAEIILNELIESSTEEYIPKTKIASIYAALDRKKEALDWLEMAYSDREYALIHINSNSRYDKLRDEARFNDILKKMGFK